MTFDEWFKAYNQKHGLPPAHVVAKAAWDYQQDIIDELDADTFFNIRWPLSVVIGRAES